MSFAGSPKVLKGALVQQSYHVSPPRIVTFQYNPDSITRTLKSDSGISGWQFRRGRSPGEWISMTAQFDATDALADSNAAVLESGLLPVLSALELMLEAPQTGVLSRVAGLLTGLSRSQSLTMLIWGRHRTVPVRIERMKIVETAFDPQLNPIRAEVELSLQVLTVDSLPRSSRGYQIYKAYVSSKESLAASLPPGKLPQ